MDTRTLCLAVLTDGPASGYEIKKAFEEHFGYFLDVSHGAIYPALADMREQGLVECEEVRQDGKPDKKLYRLTEAGRTALAEGLARSPGRHRVRSEFVALLIFSEFLPADRIRSLIDARLDEWRGMRELAQCPPDNVSEQRAGVHFAMGLCDAILQAGVDYLERNRDWLESSLQAEAASKGGKT
ncbi:PadR family transcriptional regulator [Ectothiorhodospiraceae bacterium WFHF3C12]|nr:PadR family transcriptional regulator [Ectothiorhodospiraceae bacterium WFHF3C12]